MALYFSQSVQTMMSNHQVYVAIGVWFDFLSGAERVWLGRGTITHTDGTVWLGMGELASIDGLSPSPMLATDPITMKLSGLDTNIMASVKTQATDIRNRRCGVYILPFSGDSTPLDAPYLVDMYMMDKATLSVDGESMTMTVTLTAEPLFASKYMPSTSYVTHADQTAAAKYPGDRIFERVSLLAGKQTIVWSNDT